GDGVDHRPAHPRRDSQRASAGIGGRDPTVVRPGANPLAGEPRQTLQPRRRAEHQSLPRAPADPADPNRPHQHPLPPEPGLLRVTDRRTFLKTGAAGVAAGLGLPPSFPRSLLTPLPPPPETSTLP